MISSVTRSGQETMKLCMVARAPALASRLTTQVKASPHALSLSSSFLLRGNAFLHKSIHLENVTLYNAQSTEIDASPRKIIFLLSSPRQQTPDNAAAKGHDSSNEQPPSSCSLL